MSGRRYTVDRAAPSAVREELLEFLLSHGHWGGVAAEDYPTVWDWRYTTLGEGDSLVWVARDEARRMIGHLAVYPRMFHGGGQVLRGGMPGDLLVDANWRSMVVALDLLKGPLTAVADGELDFLVAIAPQVVHRLHLRLGFRDLGVLRDHIDLWRTRGVLANRLPAAQLLAPVLDAALRIRRMSNRGLAAARRRAAGFRVVRPKEVPGMAIRREDWVDDAERVTGYDAPAFVAERFLRYPNVGAYPENRHALVLIQDADETTQGYAVARMLESAAVIRDCQTNGAVLDTTAALALVSRYFGRLVDRVVVPSAAGSRLAADLKRLGCISRVPDHSFSVALYWDGGHTISGVFSDLAQWQIFSGLGDY